MNFQEIPSLSCVFYQTRNIILFTQTHISTAIKIRMMIAFKYLDGRPPYLFIYLFISRVSMFWFINDRLHAVLREAQLLDHHSVKQVGNLERVVYQCASATLQPLVYIYAIIKNACYIQAIVKLGYYSIIFGQ